MQAPPIDELVLLPEAVALQRHFDAKNYRVFRWLLAVVALASTVGIGVSIADGSSLLLAVHAADLVVTLALFAVRNEPFFERFFRQILIGYASAQLAPLLLGSWELGTGDGAQSAAVLFPLLLLCFRLRSTEHLVLFGAFWTLEMLYVLKAGGVALSEQGRSGTGITVLTVVCLVGAVALNQLERRRFLSVWRREHSRSRERLRMREEIEYARKIQVSMLPQSPPDVSWLDVSAASLPATEVGGDYYEYFRLTSSQLAVVVGDVAGHGLASGLLLSGVRSCLYLMEEELHRPLAVLTRLNHMVRRTTDKRTYVTLLCAVLDRDARTLTMATAGHPPVLHWSAASRALSEVGKGALPLGTALQVTYEQEERTLAPRDLLVFYTDGLVEARNAQGQEYGQSRLERALARAADARSVREIRDAVLGDLANFKGDAEQADDITLVVVRVR